MKPRVGDVLLFELQPHFHFTDIYLRLKRWISGEKIVHVGIVIATGDIHCEYLDVAGGKASVKHLLYCNFESERFKCTGVARTWYKFRDDELLPLVDPCMDRKYPYRTAAWLCGDLICTANPILYALTFGHRRTRNLTPKHFTARPFIIEKPSRY